MLGVEHCVADSINHRETCSPSSSPCWTTPGPKINFERLTPPVQLVKCAGELRVLFSPLCCLISAMVD